MPKKTALQSHTQAFAPVNAELVEVLDYSARPFMIMPRESALAQQLVYQAVLVVVRNRENQIYIHRRSGAKQRYSGLWNVSAAGIVQVGEALEDAALRELNEELGISGISLTHIATVEASELTDWGRISLFTSSPANILVNPDPAEISDGMFVDEDELTALLRDMPEMLTPALKWAASANNLFNA